MCLLFKSAITILDLVWTSSGKCSDMFRRHARSRIHNDAKAGKSLESAFIPWETHYPFLGFSVLAT